MAFFLTRGGDGDKRLGIYVHIPFCKSKCEYCDFYSLGGSRDPRVIDRYLQALADHIKDAYAILRDEIGFTEIATFEHMQPIFHKLR